MRFSEWLQLLLRQAIASENCLDGENRGVMFKIDKCLLSVIQV